MKSLQEIETNVPGFVGEVVEPVEKKHHHGIWYHGLRTLNGFKVSEVLEEMQQALEPAAYKKIEGGSGKQLTDIKSPYLVETLTRLYGIYGLGWWHEYGDIKVDRYVTTTSKGYERVVYDAQITDFRLYLVYVDEDGQQIIPEPVRSTGGSDNDVQEYAIRGALTNALGAAASRLLWQIHIYKDQDAPTKKAEETTKAQDESPWWMRAVEYYHKHPDIAGLVDNPTPMMNSEAGRKALSNLTQNMVGKDKPGAWFTSGPHLVNAVKKYTGYGAVEELDWFAFEKFTRYIAGPYAKGGEQVGEVLYSHAVPVKTWQAFLKAVPFEEGFILNDDQADSINVAITMMHGINTGESTLIVDQCAEMVRKHLVANAEVVHGKEKA